MYRNNRSDKLSFYVQINKVVREKNVAGFDVLLTQQREDFLCGWRRDTSLPR